MSFLDKASLVLIPSGTKEGTVFCQKPTGVWQDSTGNYDGTDPNVFNGQLDFTRASSATFVNTDGLIEVAGINVPRFDYTNTNVPKLLIERGTVNRCTYSESFDNWTKSSSVGIESDNAISPDGNLTADKMMLYGNQIGGHVRTSFGVSYASGSTLSVFVKKDTARWFALGTYLSNDKLVWFDLDNKVVGTQGASAIGEIQEYENNWYRCSIYIISGTFSNFYMMISNDDNSLNGSDGDSVWIWGAQMETRKLSSYIPTTSSTVSRDSDSIYKTSISSVIGQSEGTLFVDFELTVGPTGAPISVGDGTLSNFVVINKRDNNRIRFSIVASGTATFVYETDILSLGRHRCAIAYKQNNCAAYVDGNLIASSTSVNIPSTLSRLSLSDVATSYDFMDGLLNQALLFPTRLTNSELATLTSL